jgi:Uma2 family endonuclease
MSTAVVRRYSVAEYLDFERKSDEKHEYFDGRIFAMAGGTAPHNLIGGNIYAELRNAVRERPCRAFPSDMRLRCPTGLYTYPDVSVVCGNPEYEDSTRNVLLNPLVICEVLSPSTENYDRVGKFKHYQSIPTLREYVLISQHQVRIDHYAREPNSDRWLLTTVTDLLGVVRFPALECEVSVTEIYAKVDLVREERVEPGGNVIVVYPPQT